MTRLCTPLSALATSWLLVFPLLPLALAVPAAPQPAGGFPDTDSPDAQRLIVGNWIMSGLQRSCSNPPSACSYTFWVDEGGSGSYACLFEVLGAGGRLANETDFQRMPCGAGFSDPDPPSNTSQTFTNPSKVKGNTKIGEGGSRRISEGGEGGGEKRKGGTRRIGDVKKTGNEKAAKDGRAMVNGGWDANLKFYTLVVTDVDADAMAFFSYLDIYIQNDETAPTITRPAYKIGTFGPNDTVAVYHDFPGDNTEEQDSKRVDRESVGKGLQEAQMVVNTEKRGMREGGVSDADGDGVIKEETQKGQGQKRGEGREGDEGTVIKFADNGDRGEEAAVEGRGDPDDDKENWKRATEDRVEVLFEETQRQEKEQKRAKEVVADVTGGGDGKENQSMFVGTAVQKRGDDDTENQKMVVGRGRVDVTGGGDKEIQNMDESMRIQHQQEQDFQVDNIIHTDKEDVRVGKRAQQQEKTWQIMGLTRSYDASSQVLHMNFVIRDSDGPTYTCYLSVSDTNLKSHWYSQPCNGDVDNAFLISWGYKDDTDSGIMTVCDAANGTDTFFGFDNISTNTYLGSSKKEELYQTGCA